MKAALMIFRIMLIVSLVGLAFTMPSWKERVLAVLFGIANTIIFFW